MLIIITCEQIFKKCLSLVNFLDIDTQESIRRVAESVEHVSELNFLFLNYGHEKKSVQEVSLSDTWDMDV